MLTRKLYLYGLSLFVIVLHFATMPKYPIHGDAFVVREEARSLILRRELALDPDILPLHIEKYWDYVENPRDHRWYSIFGTGNSLMSTIPMLVEKWVTGEIPAWSSRIRVLVLNFFNILLSVISIILMFEIGLEFVPTSTAVVAFILAVVYGSFEWYYYRAQTGEINQILFFNFFFLTSLRLFKGRHQDTNLILAWISLFLLCLVKVTFTPFILVFSYFVFRHFNVKKIGQKGDLLRSLGPAVLIAFLIGWHNYYKYGAPWWCGFHAVPMGDPTPLASIKEYLFGRTRGMFVHFPALAFALPMWGTFFKKYRTESLFIWSLFIVHFLVILYPPILTIGRPYGPRYLAFILPFMALPLLVQMNWFFANRESLALKHQLIAAVTVATVIFSGVIHWQVHAIDFRSYVAIDPTDRRSKYYAPEFSSAYFLGPNGLSLWLINFYRNHENDLPYLPSLRRALGDEKCDRYIRELNLHLTHRNLYWVETPPGDEPPKI